MSVDARWRRTLLAVCLLTTTMFAYCVYSSQRFASPLGMPGGQVNQPFEMVVRDVDPRSAAGKASLRGGDVLMTELSDWSTRYRLLSQFAFIGERHVLHVRRGSTPISLQLVATNHYRYGWSEWVAAAGAVISLLVAGVLAVRRSDSLEARLLCLLLLAPFLSTALSLNNFLTPWPPLDLAVNITSFLVSAASSWLLVRFLFTFGEPISRVRWIAAAAFLAVTVTSAGYNIVSTFGFVFHWFDWSPANARSALAFDLLQNAAGLVCIVLALVSARGRGRELLAWSVPMFVMIQTSNIASDVLFIGNVTSPLLNNFLFYVGNVALFIGPVSIAYAMLNRRLVDIGFALNRAAVFSAISLIIVSLFVVIEWALSEWFTAASHTENALIAGGAALVMGLSLRFVHTYVDDVIDRTLFAKRHRDLDAIADMTREAPYITKRDILLERVRASLEDHADASSSFILESDGAGHYGVIDENDPAIVALRAKHDTLDLHHYETAIHGDYAIPMVSRGRLVAVLALGHKNSGDSYAPDELQAIRHMAHSVGSSLEVLSHQTSVDPIVEQLESIQRTLAALPSALRDAVTESRVAGS